MRLIGKKSNWPMLICVLFLFPFCYQVISEAQTSKIELSIEETNDQNPYLNYPVGVLVQEGTGSILISDWANNRLVVTDQTGKTKKIIPNLEGPVGIAYDRTSNRMYLTEQKANRLRILDGSSYAPVGEIKIKGITLNEPRGIWIDSERKIYVVDTMNSRILILDASGNLLKTVGKEGMGNDEFYYPRGVSVDTQGRIWMTDTLHHTVKVFDRNGEYLFRLGKEGAGPEEFNRPRYVVAKDNIVIISDYQNNRLKIYTTQGELTGIISTIQGDRLLNPEGLWIDDQGFLWVADSGNNRILKINMTFLLNREAYLKSLLASDKIDEFLKEAANISSEKRDQPSISRMFYEVYQKKDDLEKMITEAENLWMNDEENRQSWSNILGQLYYRKALVSRPTQPALVVKELFRKSLQYGYKRAYGPYIWTSFLMLGGSNLFLLVLGILFLVLVFILFRIRLSRLRRW